METQQGDRFFSKQVYSNIKTNVYLIMEFLYHFASQFRQVKFK